MSIVIDDEFAALLTPLTAEEATLLERSLLNDGCVEPLSVWMHNEVAVLLDGHARLMICNKHGIPFETTTVDLADREVAREWILARQLGRRNLPPIAQSYYRGKLYLSAAKRPGARTDLTPGQTCRQWASQAIAERYGVHEKTIRRDAELAAAVDGLTSDPAFGPTFRVSVLTRQARLTRSDLIRMVGMQRHERIRFREQRTREQEEGHRRNRVSPETPSPKSEPIATTAKPAADRNSNLIEVFAHTVLEPVIVSAAKPAVAGEEGGRSSNADDVAFEATATQEISRPAVAFPASHCHAPETAVQEPDAELLRELTGLWNKADHATRTAFLNATMQRTDTPLRAVEIVG